jgi:hypothetical protein
MNVRAFVLSYPALAAHSFVRVAGDTLGPVQTGHDLSELGRLPLSAGIPHL